MTDIFVRRCPFCGGQATVRWNVNKVLTAYENSTKSKEIGYNHLLFS